MESPATQNDLHHFPGEDSKAIGYDDKPVSSRYYPSGNNATQKSCSGPGSSSIRNSRPQSGGDDPFNATVNVSNASLSGFSSTFSSWSSCSTGLLGQQHNQQHQRQPRQTSTASSAFSSIASEPPGYYGVVVGGSALPGGGGGGGPVSTTAYDRSSNLDEDRKEANKGIAVVNSSGSTSSESGGGGDGDKGSLGSSCRRPKPRSARSAYAGAMEVEEVDVEDFCLDDELENYTRMEREGGGVGGGERAGWKPPEIPHSTGREQGSRARASCVDAGRNMAGKAATGGAVPCTEWEKRAVTEMEANDMRTLIFGDSSKQFNAAWREQGFYFCGVDGLGYGLVQAEGGPCGVLAAVQAFFLDVSAYAAGRAWGN